MLETDTIVFMLLFCALAAAFPFVRAMILRSGARAGEYLDKVDPEQEMIPVDETSWYYRALKKQNITTNQELSDFLVRGLHTTSLMDIKIICYLFLVSGIVVYGAFIVFLISMTEETKVNIALLLGASSCVIGYLLVKTLLDNSKAVNRAREDYLRRAS